MKLTKATKHLKTNKLRISIAHRHAKRGILSIVAVAGVSLLVAGSFALAASSTPQIYVAPSGGTYNVGADIAVAVRENGNGSAINAAQVGLTYKASQLQFTSIDSSSSAFSTDLTPGTQSSGEVVLTRASLSSSFTTDELIATVHFTALTAGTATVGFTSSCQGSSSPAADCTGLSSAGASIAITTTGGSYTLQTPVTPTCPSGDTGTYPNCVAPTVPTSPTTPTSPSSGSGSSAATKSTSTSITPSGSQSSITAPDNSQVEVTTPSDIQPATIQPDGVQKIQYYLNNKLVYTANSVPYTYHIDTKHLLNGTYTLTSITYYISGRKNTTTQKLIIKNPFSFVQFGLLLRHYVIEIVIPLVLIILAIGLLYYRLRHNKWYKGPGSSHMDKPGTPTPTLNVQGPTVVTPSAH